MVKKLTEYQKAIASAYLLLVLAVLPFYMRDGFIALGDVKFLFYRNISLLFLILWAAGQGAAWILQKGVPESAARKLQKGGLRKRSVGITKRRSQKAHPDQAEGKMRGIRRDISTTDIFAGGFFIASCLSYVFSNYKDTALWGYPGWYMGLFFQLILVWSYFFISRWYTKDKLVWFCIWMSVFAVCLLGIINRTGRDPLGVFQEMSWWDWNRRNLLSTIGNINWYCGYLAVMLPLLLYCFWAGEGKSRFLSGVGAYIGIGAMTVQASMSGYLALPVMYMALLLGSLKEVKKLLRFLETVMLIPLFWSVMTLFQIDLLLPFDKDFRKTVYSPYWGLLLAVILLAYWAIRFAYKRTGRDFLEDGRVYKAVIRLCIAGVLIGILILAGCQISDDLWRFLGSPDIVKFNREWGSLRGGLWAETWRGFLKCSLVQKLFGVGPDCFACYFYGNNLLDIGTTGQWQEAIYANAHNEWLNILVNEGILGAVTYIGFYASAFYRFLKSYRENTVMMLGMMAVVAYVVNDFFSFGQVVSTPLVFLLIAVCENECRRKKEIAEEAICSAEGPQ